MTDEIQEEITPEEPIVQEEPVVESAPEVDQETIEEAKKYGWRPKDDFDLAPDGWVDAERFMELPATQVKVQRDTNKALQSEVQTFGERMARMEAMNKTTMDMALERQRAEHQQQLAHLNMQQREAVETANVEQFDEIEQQKAQLAPPPPPQSSTPPLEDTVAKYGDKFSWLKDPESVAIGATILEHNPDIRQLAPEQQFQFVTNRLQAIKPQTEAKPKPRVQRTDEGGLGGGMGGQRTLPPEAMSAAKEYVADGVFPTVEAYAKVYWEQNA